MQMLFSVDLPALKSPISRRLRSRRAAKDLATSLAKRTSTAYNNLPKMDTIKIVIVEDELQYREWITEELAATPEIEVIAAFATGEEALEKVSALQPDLVIMDLMLGKNRMSGSECIFRLRLESPGLKFLVLSSHIDETHVFQALKVGARAYLQKGDIPGRLPDLIRDFHRGVPSMSPVIAQMMMDHFNKAPETLRLLEKLSKREEEVLRTLAEGLTYLQAGDRLFIAEGTVRQHAHRIYDKLGVNCLAEAIKIYLH